MYTKKVKMQQQQKQKRKHKIFVRRGNRTVSLAPQFQSKTERIECGQAVEMCQRYASTH